MTVDELLAEGAAPIVAILRGVKPDEVVAITRGLIEAGVRMIEVPLNSPEPIDSIARIQAEFGGDAVLGAGTVLSREKVDAVAATGARLIVTPNTDTAVISHAASLGLDVMPGFVTPSEAFQAIGAGAKRLKLFPGAQFGPGYVKAVKDVLPREVGVWAVGGAGASNFAEWLAAGCAGIGVGGSLYKPGDGAETVAGRGRALVAAWQAARG